MTEGLDYERYVAQSGDWGSAVSTWIGFDHPDSCRDLHLNMVLARGADSVPETEEEKRWDAEFRRRFRRALAPISHFQPRSKTSGVSSHQ